MAQILRQPIAVWYAHHKTQVEELHLPIQYRLRDCIVRSTNLQESHWTMCSNPSYNLTDFKILGSISNRVFYF